MTVCLYHYNLDFWLEGQLFFIIQICRGRNVWSWWLTLLYVACKRIGARHSVQFKIHIPCLRKGQLLFSKNHSASPKNVSEADIINKFLIDNTFDMFDWSGFSIDSHMGTNCAFLFGRGRLHCSHLSHWTRNKGYHRYSFVCFMPWSTPRNWQWRPVKSWTLRQRTIFQSSQCELSIYM